MIGRRRAACEFFQRWLEPHRAACLPVFAKIHLILLALGVYREGYLSFMSIRFCTGATSA